MVLTLVGSQAPIAHPGTAPCSRTALQRRERKGPHVLEGGEENDIFLKTIATCEACLVQVFLKQHVST